MKKIITTIYLLFIVVILNGCETSQSLKTETKEKLLSFETKLITNSGPVVGYVDQSGIHKWLGIPFAESPVQELRWRAPKKIKSWEETKEVNFFSLLL
jgi:para-nitrobenzyl esterase